MLCIGVQACQLVRTGAGSAAAEASPRPSLDDLASFAGTHLLLPVCLEDLKTVQLHEEQASCFTSYKTWGCRRGIKVERQDEPRA